MVNQADALKIKLDHLGIMTCNSTTVMPNIIDSGFVWQDVTELIDNHQLFYCKAFQRRTTYLSPEVYYLLKKHKKQQPMDDAAKVIFSLLQNNLMETKELKAFSFLPKEDFKRSFEFLLRERYITAYKNGKILNANWSSFVYSTAEKWEQAMPATEMMDTSLEKLTDFLSPILSPAQQKRFLC